ncbi:MAG: oligosaccharide flippase family protein [Anaerolineae bacterium]|jgi:O-antigen/teichoic acid export membrane protein
MSTSDKQLPRGALLVAMGQGTFVLSGFLLHLLLARKLTPAMFGIFNVAMAVLVWLEIMVNNGVPVALQRFLPDRNLSETSVLHVAARCQALVGVAVFAAMFLAAPLLADGLRDPAMTKYLRLASVDILVMSAYAYYRGTLNGWRAFRQLSLTIAAYALTKIVAILSLVYLSFGVEGALVGNAISSVGGLAMGYFFARRYSSEPADNSHEREVNERRVMAFVLPAALFTLASNILLGLDLMGVKALISDPDLVGYYSAAVKLAEAPRLILLAFSFTLLPSLSHAIAAQDPDQTRHDLEQVIRLLALVLLPIVALVTATAGAAIKLIFPAQYAPAAPILTVLIVTYSTYTVYITLVTALLAENRPGRALAIPLGLLPLAVGAVWFGVFRFGLLGAAFASLLSVSLAATTVVVYVFWRFGPRPGLLARSLLRIGLASAAVWGIARLWAPSGLMLIAAYGVLSALCLALLLVLGEIRRRDLVEVFTLLPRSNRKQGA